MKKGLCIIFLMYITCLAFPADRPSPDIDKAYTSIDLISESYFFYESPLPLSSITPYDTDTVDSKKDKKNPFLHITATYILPVSYFALSIFLKEAVYTDAPGDNTLLYINPVVTSIVAFGSAGFFAGLALGLIFNNNDGFVESFLYMTIVGALLGITGMIAGSIYAFIEYDSIIENEFFYYGAPSFYLLIPIVDIFSNIFDD